MTAARAAGVVVSYDLNYRDSLWKYKGGRAAADEISRKLLPLADVVFGVFDLDPHLDRFDEQRFRSSAEAMAKDFPDLKIIASTLRNVFSASRHDLSAAAFVDGEVIKLVTIRALMYSTALAAATLSLRALSTDHSWNAMFGTRWSADWRTPF